MPTRNWPHPVLDPTGEDYLNCAFQASMQVRQTRTAYSISARFDLGCETLEDAVGGGDAAFAVQVSCPRTAYRAIFSATDPAIQFDIPEFELRETFIVLPLVVAARPFELSSQEFAPLFSNSRFPIDCGAVLATATSVEYRADKAFDELKNISAIFEVIKQPDTAHACVEYDLTRDKIAIVLPEAIYDNYRLFRSRSPYRESFVCSLVLPGLTAALENLRAADEEYSDGARWRRVLRRRLAEIDRASFQPEDAFKIAQELLDFPFGRALNAIRNAEMEEH